MDTNSEKKSKRPRIAEPRPSAAAQAEAAAPASAPASDAADQSGSYAQNGYQRQQPTTYPRQQYPRSNYQPRSSYGQTGTIYPRQTPYGQPRPYSQPRSEGSDESVSTEQTQESGYQRQQTGYQPRPRYNQGGYGQQRPYNNQNRQGGYQQRQPRPYGQQGGYQQRPYNSQPRPYNNTNPATGEEGAQPTGYQPRPRYNQGGYGQQRPYNNQNRQGGYNNQGKRPYNNQNRQGGYGQPRPYGQRQPRPYGQQGGPRQNRFGMPQGGKSFTPRPKRIEYDLPAPDPDEQIRLNKYMANAGICSRREADEFIRQGLVKVNGEVVTELGTKITPKDVVEYDEKVVTLERKTYILLNKPKDCVTTSDDPNGRTTVLDLVKGACDERIYPVGRLDRNTTGVLLLTNDGDLASKLTHPKYVKKKIYHVWVDKDITEDDMQAIADGIELEDGPIHADAISYATETDRNQAGIEIHSGRNRIVRRIFEKLGYHVTKLDRVYFAGLTKKNLPRGRWRYLTQEEVNFLKMGSFEQ